MTESDRQLIETARAFVGDLPLRGDLSAGTVGAALRTDRGNTYTGISIVLASGLGFCAEIAAVAEMLKHGETRIDTVVAATDDRILPPCGRCRETMAQIDEHNLDGRILLEEGRVLPLRELLPEHWMTEAGS